MMRSGVVVARANVDGEGEGSTADITYDVAVDPDGPIVGFTARALKFNAARPFTVVAAAIGSPVALRHAGDTIQIVSMQDWPAAGCDA